MLFLFGSWFFSVRSHQQQKVANKSKFASLLLPCSLYSKTTHRRTHTHTHNTTKPKLSHKSSSVWKASSSSSFGLLGIERRNCRCLSNARQLVHALPALRWKPRGSVASVRQTKKKTPRPQDAIPGEEGERATDKSYRLKYFAALSLSVSYKAVRGCVYLIGRKHMREQCV